MSTQISNAVTSSGETGSECESSGPYSCKAHVEIIVFFRKGDKFSNCPVLGEISKVEGHATTWIMVREALVADEK
ncbi:MAG: hypothetical protein WCF57_06980 [Pyrinomonadaceae bacterium]